MTEISSSLVMITSSFFTWFHIGFQNETANSIQLSSVWNYELILASVNIVLSAHSSDNFVEMVT